MKPKYNQPTIVFAIGLPACGKTTDSLQTYPGYNHLSKDLIRFDEYDFETTGIDFKAEDEPRILKLFLAKLDDLVAKKQNIFVDNTNLTRAKRAEIIAHVGFDYHIILKVYLVPYHVCLGRNSARARKVPLESMERMYTELELPTYEECLMYEIILHTGETQKKQSKYFEPGEGIFMGYISWPHTWKTRVANGEVEVRTDLNCAKGDYNVVETQKGDMETE